MEHNNRKKVLVGRVVSDKMDKTITAVEQATTQSMLTAVTTLKIQSMMKTMLPKGDIVRIMKLVRFQLQNVSNLVEVGEELGHHLIKPERRKLK